MQNWRGTRELDRIEILALAPGAAFGCALELILAVDISGSVDADEFALQTEGLAQAFETPELAEAIVHQEGGILVTQATSPFGLSL